MSKQEPTSCHESPSTPINWRDAFNYRVSRYRCSMLIVDKNIGFNIVATFLLWNELLLFKNGFFIWGTLTLAYSVQLDSKWITSYSMYIQILDPTDPHTNLFLFVSFTGILVDIGG